MRGLCKRGFLSGVLALLVCLGLTSPSGAAEPQKNTPKVIYSLVDPVGDEKGAGKYTYPISPVFAPGKGLYDLTKYTVLADLQNYYFQMTFQAMNNPWGAPEGFSHQRITLYIDSVVHQGRTEPLREGAFVEFASNYGWEYLIDIQGWKHSRIFFYTDEKASPGNKEIQVTLLPDEKTIQAKVPRKLLDDHPETWKFYVLVGAQDGLGPDGFRHVLAKSTEWQLGGGTDTYYDPNILDMLVLANSPYNQRQMLGSYSIEKGKLALLYPAIPPKPVSKLPYKQGVVGSIWTTMTAPLAAVLADYPISAYWPLYLATVVGIVIVLILILWNGYRYTHPSE